MAFPATRMLNPEKIVVGCGAGASLKVPLRGSSGYFLNVNPDVGKHAWAGVAAICLVETHAGGSVSVAPTQVGKKGCGVLWGCVWAPSSGQAGLAGCISNG